MHPSTKQPKSPSKKKSLIAWTVIPIALSIGAFLYHEQYPSAETRRELSVDLMFAD